MAEPSQADSAAPATPALPGEEAGPERVAGTGRIDLVAARTGRAGTSIGGSSPGVRSGASAASVITQVSTRSSTSASLQPVFAGQELIFVRVGEQELRAVTRSPGLRGSMSASCWDGSAENGCGGAGTRRCGGPSRGVVRGRSATSPTSPGARRWDAVPHPRLGHGPGVERGDLTRPGRWCRRTARCGPTRADSPSRRRRGFSSQAGSRRSPTPAAAPEPGADQPGQTERDVRRDAAPTNVHDSARNEREIRSSRRRSAGRPSGPRSDQVVDGDRTRQAIEWSP